MSLMSTKRQLVQLLGDADVKVVALSGNWGTGKSYMWERIQSESESDNVKDALYASLFGLSTVDQIKMKLLQSAAPVLERTPALLDGVKKIYSSSVKVLEGFHTGFGALNDIGLLVAPAVLRDKLIVLDDIERKHDRLNIDEVLGFIDEFTQRFGSRFLLILNSDRLAHREVWDTLREKVVDEELRLTTSCDEAFEIAVADLPSKWAPSILEAIRKCGVTNIRIDRKIIKAVNKVIGVREKISEAVLVRVVPPTVLLAAIHYKGIENGPDLNFVLGFGRGEKWASYLNAKRAEEQTDEEKRRAQWRPLLNDLGINSCDEFELLVAEYLQSGLFDVSKVATIIDRYEEEHEAIAARNAFHVFFQNSFWEHRLTEGQLLEQAESLMEKVRLVDANTATQFHELLLELPGGELLAGKVIPCWIEAFQSTPVFRDSVFRQRVHPAIENMFNQSDAEAQAGTTVLDACKHIVANSGWGTRQEMALQLATVEAFEAAIRTAERPDLHLLLARMLEFTRSQEQYEKHFGNAMVRFVEACRRIVNDGTVPRLAKILRHLFAEAKLDNLLESATPTSEPPNPISGNDAQSTDGAGGD